MKDERAEIFETYRSSFRLLISTITFLTTANVTIVGFAVNSRSAMLVLFGCVFPLILLFCFFLFSRLYGAIFFAGMRLHDQEGEFRSLFFSTSIFLAKPDLYHELKSIIEAGDAEQQLDRLRHIQNKFIPPFTPVIVSACALLQISISLVLWYFFDWPFS